MVGLLNNMQGGQGMADPMDAQQLYAMMQQSKVDPFSRSLPGTGLLGDGGFSGPAPQNAMEQNMAQQPQNMPQPPGAGSQVLSTDFADTQPGLPNLPDSFQGFGYGQFAPQTHQGNPLRQQLIQQLMQAYQGQQAQGGGMDNSFGMPNDLMGAF